MNEIEINRCVLRTIGKRVWAKVDAKDKQKRIKRGKAKQETMAREGSRS